MSCWMPSSLGSRASSHIIVMIDFDSVALLVRSACCRNWGLTAAFSEALLVFSGRFKVEFEFHEMIRGRSKLLIFYLRHLLVVFYDIPVKDLPCDSITCH